LIVNQGSTKQIFLFHAKQIQQNNDRINQPTRFL